jgi:hypothetical protein
MPSSKASPGAWRGWLPPIVPDFGVWAGSPGLLYNSSMLKNLRLVLIISFLLASCVPGQAVASTLTPAQTLTQVPTASLTPSPTPTATPSPEPTITPTSEISMHVGADLPATVGDCDVIRGSTLQQRREADKAALAALNGDVWFAFSTRHGDAKLPLPFSDYYVTPQSILSCSTYRRDGERVIMFGIATSPNTMMYINYDEAAAKNFIVTAAGGDGEWVAYYSFDTMLSKLKGGQLSGVLFGVFYDREFIPMPRPSQNFGFEEVWEIFDIPLPEPFTLRGPDGQEFTVNSFARFAFSVLPGLRKFDPGSRQKILEQAEKYYWPGSVIMMVQK